MRAAASFFCTALLLAGCSGPEREEQQTEAAGAPVDLETLPQDESAATPTAALANGVTEPVVVPDSKIPVRFHGRWALREQDCSVDQPNRGLVTISAATIRFHDSIAVAGDVQQLSPTAIRGQFAFTGALGRTWTAPLAMRVDDPRFVLIEGAGIPTRVYSRCNL